MRITPTLYRQHIGRYFKEHWIVQGKRVVRDLGALKSLKEKGIPVYDPKDIVSPKQEFQLIDEVPDYIPQPIKRDNTHPNWHKRICYTYRDDNVLLEGLNQAKIVTKTVELARGLPKEMDATCTVETDRNVKKIILYSHVFDAEQQKLPKLKDETRPAWNFPRIYGITEQRVNKLLVNKLLQLIEMISSPDIVKQRNIVNDLHFCYSFEKDGELFQLRLRGDTLVTSAKPLNPISNETVNTDTLELPNLFPIKHTVTFNTENVYEIRNIYPIEKFITKSHPHTVFVHYNNTEVKNLFEEDVTENQIFGRSLLKTFAVAASYAKNTFGQGVGVLPRPVTVQCVQTDGRLFHFGILQLNTLDLEEGGIKNIWWQTPRIPLFNFCGYKIGKPTLEGFHNDAVKHLIGFYNNV